MGALKTAKTSLSRLVEKLREATGEQSRLRAEHARIIDEIRVNTPGSPACDGWKCYSQCDEDGVIAAIFTRIGTRTKQFVEIGCGNGLENNSHALALIGWGGVWVDADIKNISFMRTELPSASGRLDVIHAEITAQNAADVVGRSRIRLVTPVDFLSVDIDGDELGVAAALIPTLQPRVICIEYNAKFPPPMRITAAHRRGFWKNDDYHGASLAEIEAHLAPMGYRLICCNASGANAFFVANSCADAFDVYSLSELYRPAAYELRRLKSGHPPTLRFLADSLSAG
jgi:hypothetical protein